MNSVLPRAIALSAVLAFAIPAFAQETRSFTAPNGTFDIPVAPQRIVALNDQLVALPLLEMGAPVVGTAGRIDAQGNTFIRGGMDTLGIDFSNSDIAFVGTFNDLDVEAIARLDPDLIIGGQYTDADVAEQLQSVAPTILLDNVEMNLVQTFEALADISGREDEFGARFQRYLDNVARTKAYIGTPEDISVTLTFMFPRNTEMWVYKSGLGAISQVVADLGFAESAAVARMETPQISYSPELIEDLDADFIFGFYRQQPDATPQAIFETYEAFAPGWCQALSACRNGQFILLPGPTFGPTMTALELALELVESHVAGRQFTPFEGAN